MEQTVEATDMQHVQGLTLGKTYNPRMLLLQAFEQLGVTHFPGKGPQGYMQSNLGQWITSFQETAK